MTKTNAANHLMGIAAAIGLCACLGGCETLSKPTGAAFASVEIKQHSRQEIEDATIRIFERAGYQSVVALDELVFESEGKEWMQLAYGSNIALADGGPVMERVKVRIVDLTDGTYRLQCNAYVIPPGTYETKEVKLLITRSGPYRDLLEEIVRELSETP
ncbi:MAG TPA: hypothetical protein VLL07_02200 [Pontiella sp.]|nr:hypothetical protein [Pontiella sp.]